MLYKLHDMQHAMMVPARMAAEYMQDLYRNPWNPLSHTQAGRTIAASAEVFERMTRRFGKPAFNIHDTVIGGKEVEVHETCITHKPFCTLTHFNRETKRNDPKVLLVTPISGHYSTLLTGTVKALLPHHDVYVTDWINAKQVPLSDGKFDLDDYIAYLRDFLSLLGPDTHVIAVCQPAVPVFATIALMEADNDPNCPLSMTLMGGPIDPRVSKTVVTKLAEDRPLSWFKNTVIADVPFYHPGGGRKVYPGFLQLSGFMSMNLDRHVDSHVSFYQHLVSGDGESAEQHRKFYNEYMSVMDISAEFFLQTVETVFQKHSLPKGEMVWLDPLSKKKIKVDAKKIKKTALLTIEGELDDISAHGQTTAAHSLCVNLPAKRKYHHFQENVGHYGIFNGRRWRNHIMPRIRHFIRQFETDCDPIPKADLKFSPDKSPEQWDPAKHSIEAVNERLKNKVHSQEIVTEAREHTLDEQG